MTVSNEKLFNMIIELKSELYELKKENDELKDMMRDQILYLIDIVSDHDKKFFDLEKFIKMGKKLTELEKEFSNES